MGRYMDVVSCDIPPNKSIEFGDYTSISSEILSIYVRHIDPKR